MRRLLAYAFPVLVLVPLAAGACSKSDDNAQTATTAAAGPIATESPAQTDAYCTVVRNTVNLAKQYASSTPPPDAAATFAKQLTNAAAKAPAAIKSAFTAAAGTDANAKATAEKTISDFNKTVCGVDTSGIPGTS